MRYDQSVLVQALQNANVLAFLGMLRLGEGTRGENGYRTMYGGGLFDDFADHPRRKVTAGRWTSTAAGAYQFLERTWDGLVKQYGFTDFSPKNQDLAAVALIRGRKALDDVIAGRFEQAVMKCNKEWASLPGSPYGQPVVTMAQAKAEYERRGGAYAPVAPLAPAVATPPQNSGVPLLEPVPPPPNPFLNEQEASMPPFLAAALPAVIGAVPELLRLFGAGGSPTSQRNLKAAEVVVGIAKDAIGARNEQELIESLAADPQAAAAVRQAVQDNWFRIEEVGGGVTAAREAAVKLQGGKSLWHNPAFVVSLLLMVFPTMLLVDVFFIHPDSYEADGLRTQIVTGVLMVISMVGAFWLGTSFSSSKKDDAILSRV